MTETHYNIAEMVASGMTATHAFQTAAGAGNMPIYFPAQAEPYALEADILFNVTANPVTIYGDGAHASILEFDSTDDGLIVDQRDGETLTNFQNWQFNLSDMCIRYASSRHGQEGSAALTLFGRATENTLAGLLSVRRVQFGRTDKRNPGHQAYPGTWEYYPEMWVNISGVFGLEIQRCNFAGQIQGGLDKSGSYYPPAGIRFTTGAGIFTEIGGQRLEARSMRNVIRGCDFSAGVRIPIECQEEHWIEGTLIDRCNMVGTWKGVHIRGDQAHNTQMIVCDSHICFRRAGIDVEAGAGVILKDNYFIARADGYYEPTNGEKYPHFIRIGEAKADYGAVLSTISGNIFGSSPGNKPKYAVVVDGSSAHVYIDRNHYQGIDTEVAILSEYCFDISKDGLQLA